MWVLGVTEYLEARALKRKPRATHRERRHVARKTGDGACRDCGSGTVGVERIGKAVFKKSSQALPTCNLLYCCTRIDTVDGRRVKHENYILF